MFLSYEEVAAHLRVDVSDIIPGNEFLAPDVAVYMKAACDTIEELTGATYTAANVPTRLKVAALLLVGDLYENRESSTVAALRENPALMRLLMPYRLF